MANKQFKAESKRLLDLMINSIYTNKEIFLRELISNGSDAIDKLHYRSLTDDKIEVKQSDFAIRIDIDKANRNLTISDNGCGMTESELENNLGTIAKSGSLNFKKENEKKEDIEIIGQFGVGFYSAFMVSDDIFGTEAMLDSHWNYESIKLGDIIEHRDENGKTYHWSIVNTIDTAPDGSVYVKVVSGDDKGLIRWNAMYYLDKFDTEVIWSRYPK